MIRATQAIAAVLVLTVAGCGGSGDTSSDSAVEPSASESVYDVDSATDAEQWAEYQRLISEQGLERYAMERGEAEDVAANLCDNSVGDHRTLIEMNQMLYNRVIAQEEAMDEKRTIAQVWCPEALEDMADAVVAEKEKQQRIADRPKAKDVRIGIRIREQQCFGSAGCNITFQINPTYVGPSSLDGVFDVTYKVVGGEDPYVNTFVVRNGGARYDREEFISTGPNPKLTAKATSVYPR